MFGIQRNSDTVFIIGGGPSLNKYLPDKTVLDGKDIIAVNSAYKFFPNAICCMFMDMHWFLGNKDHLLSTFKGVPIVGAFPNEILEYRDRYKFDNILTREGDSGLSTNDKTIVGSNSGHMAINLAVKLGYKDIVLLGFDMDKLNPVTHWHKEYIRQSMVDRYDSVMIPYLNTINAHLPSGVSIWNINKESAIKCFPFTELERFL